MRKNSGHYLDLSLREEPGSDLEHDALVLEERPDGAVDHGAAVRRAVDLALKVVDASLRPAMGRQTSVCGWRLHITEVAYWLLTQQHRVQFPAFTNFFQRKNYLCCRG